MNTRNIEKYRYISDRIVCVCVCNWNTDPTLNEVLTPKLVLLQFQTFGYS